MIGDDRPRKHLFTFLNENQSISKKRTFKEIFSFSTDFQTDLQDEDVSRSVAFVTMQLLISNCIIFKSCRKRNVRFFSWENGKWQEIKIFSMKMINYRKKRKYAFYVLLSILFLSILTKTNRYNLITCTHDHLESSSIRDCSHYFQSKEILPLSGKDSFTYRRKSRRALADGGLFNSPQVKKWNCVTVLVSIVCTFFR